MPHDLSDLIRINLNLLFQAAFLIPIINNLLSSPSLAVDKGKRKVPATPQVLILGPTRELVVQICNEAISYARKTVLENTIHVVYGGTNMSEEQNRITVSFFVFSVTLSSTAYLDCLWHLGV